MSIGLGNIIVQNKKEPAGVSEAESGLHMDGSKARLGGMLLENTDIDIDTKTFFLQWDGGAGAFLIDVFNDKYFFGTIDGSFNLETGFIFKENEAAVKLNGNAAVSARGQAGVGAGIVYEFGDVESVNNGTKITIKDDTETVEITNIPEADSIGKPILFLQGNRIVASSKANLKNKNFTSFFNSALNINSQTIDHATYSICNNLLYINISVSFKVTDNTDFVDLEVSFSDALLEGVNLFGEAYAGSVFYNSANLQGVAYCVANTDTTGLRCLIFPINNSGSQTDLNTVFLSAVVPIYSFTP